MNKPNVALLVHAAVLLAPALPLHALPLNLGQEFNLHSLNRGEPQLGRLAGLPEPVRFYGGRFVSKFYGGFGGAVPETETILSTCMADVQGDGNSDIVYLLHVNGAPVNEYVIATYYGHVSGFTSGPRETVTLSGFEYGFKMQMEPADMNRDGFPDIVLFARTSSATRTHHVKVFFNNVNLGRFSTSVSVTSSLESAAKLSGIAVLHANADDYLDIVVANRTTNALTIYLNNSAASFTASPTVLSESLPTRLWVHDMDRDGKRDLVVASGGAADADALTRHLSWRRFQGLSFAAPVQLDSFSGDSAEYGGMAFGDVNDDGAPDVVFARNYQTPAYTSDVWFRAGADGSPGTFAPVSEITSAAGTTSLEYPVYGVAVADYDRDGDSDLLMHAGYRDSDGYVLERIVANRRVHGDSAGVVATHSGTPPTGVTSLTTADVNGDSWMDLVAASGGARAILWYPGLPAGGFGNAVSISTGANAPSSVVAGDIDHDGDCDLAWAQASTGEVKRAFNNNKIGTSWGQATLLSVPGILSLTAGNANADADMDLITVAGSGAVTWHYNSNDGDTWTADLAQTLPGARQAAMVRVETGARSQLATVSLPVSGDPAVMNVKNFLFFSTPQWQTMLSENGTASGTASAVTSGDFDRDGNMDIAWAAGSNEVKWRNPVATINPAVTIGTAPGNVRTLRCMDWNSDGWEDVLCAHSTGVTVWLRKSSTVWTALALYTGGDCSDAVPVHIDHDAHIDVVAADASAGALKLITHGPVSHLEMADAPVTTGGASLRMDAAQTAYVLKLDCTHLGNKNFQLGNGGYGDDAPLTLSHLRLRFVRAVPSGATWTPGLVLSDSAVAASVDKVLLVEESSNSSNPTLDASDTILAEAAVSTSFGYVSLTVNSAALELEPRATARYYLALKMKPTVSSVLTGRFFVQHIINPQLAGSRAKALGQFPASVQLNTTGTSGPGQLINLTTPYEIWRMANFGTYNNSGIAADNYDGDKDGLTNLGEYILQRNPVQADAPNALKLLPGFGPSPMLRAELPAVPREDGIVFIQQSNTIGPWTTLSQRTGNSSWAGATVTPVITFAGTTHWNINPPAATRTFFRIQFGIVP